MEAIGVVEAVGPGLTGRQVGNLVAYAGNPMGSYAEEQILPADRAIPVPSSIVPAIAASVMPKGITAQFLVRCCYKATEKTELKVSVRCPRTGSLFNYLIHNKYPFLNEILVKETHLFRQISAQEFDENNHFEGSGLIRSSPEPAAIRGMFNKEITTPLMSQLKSNVMVQWVIRRLFKFLNRQGDSSTDPPQSSGLLCLLTGYSGKHCLSKHLLWVEMSPVLSNCLTT